MASLSSQPSELEVKQALFAMNPTKAAGPDGFSAGFYQSQWDVVKANLISLSKDIFSKVRSVSNINHTFISLIPKISATGPLVYVMLVTKFCLKF